MQLILWGHSQQSNCNQRISPWGLIKTEFNNAERGASRSPWFRYVSVSSCSLTAGDVAAHSTYWNGGFLVSFSEGRLVSSCLKIGRASTSLRHRERQKKPKTNAKWFWGCRAEKSGENPSLGNICGSFPWAETKTRQLLMLRASQCFGSLFNRKSMLLSNPWGPKWAWPARKQARL